MSFPMMDMESLFGELPNGLATTEKVIGPAVAAAMVPVAASMAGWVALWGFGIGMASVAAGVVERTVGEAPAKVLKPNLRLIETAFLPGSNVVPLAKAEPKTAATAPASKAPASNAAAPKAAAPKPVESKPVASKPVESKPVESKSSSAKVAAPKVAKPGVVVSAPASSAAPVVAAPPVAAPPDAPAPAVVPLAPKPAVVAVAPRADTTVRIGTKTSSKGITLAKVSIQDDKPSLVASNADKPKGLAVARAGGPDDLKMISGVGPKIEGILHGLGIYHFDQVAAWTPKEIAWVDQYLKFNGRIVRDGWIAQADALAAGGADEYRKRFGKDPR